MVGGKNNLKQEFGFVQNYKKSIFRKKFWKNLEKTLF